MPEGRSARLARVARRLELAHVVPAATLRDHTDARTIEVSASLGPDRPALLLRWERRVIDRKPDPGSEQLLIAGGNEFHCIGVSQPERGAWFQPATPDVLRGLSALFAQLALRVERDRVVYEALAELHL